MKRYLCLLALGWLACLTTPVLAGENHSAVAGESHVALVKSLNGDVQVTRDRHAFRASSGTALHCRFPIAWSLQLAQQQPSYSGTVPC